MCMFLCAVRVQVCCVYWVRVCAGVLCAGCMCVQVCCVCAGVLCAVCACVCVQDYIDSVTNSEELTQKHSI